LERLAHHRRQALCSCTFLPSTRHALSDRHRYVKCKLIRDANELPASSGRLISPVQIALVSESKLVEPIDSMGVTLGAYGRDDVDNSVGRPSGALVYRKLRRSRSAHVSTTITVPTSIASESKLAGNSSEYGQHGRLKCPHGWARLEIDGHIESPNGPTVAVLPASAHAALHFAEHRLPTGGKIGVTDVPKGVRKPVQSNQPLDRISSIDAGGKGGRSLGLCLHVTHHDDGVLERSSLGMCCPGRSRTVVVSALPDASVIIAPRRAAYHLVHGST
jgi:hypothetical protein